MASFVLRKKPFVQRQKKVPKIKSLLLENSLNIINNRRNNKILYKVESQHLVTFNTFNTLNTLKKTIMMMINKNSYK